MTLHCCTDCSKIKILFFPILPYYKWILLYCVLCIISHSLIRPLILQCHPQQSFAPINNCMLDVHVHMCAPHDKNMVWFHVRVAIPEIYYQFSSHNVLTMEYIEGIGIRDKQGNLGALLYLKSCKMAVCFWLIVWIVLRLGVNWD